MEISELEKRIIDLEKRVIVLESARVREKSVIVKPSTDERPKYKGPTGGIMFLIDGGFFNKIRSSKEVYEKLKEEGYIYRAEAVDTILRRDFVVKKKTLSRIRDEKIWKYGLRK